MSAILTLFLHNCKNLKCRVKFYTAKLAIYIEVAKLPVHVMAGNKTALATHRGQPALQLINLINLKNNMRKPTSQSFLA